MKHRIAGLIAVVMMAFAVAAPSAGAATAKTNRIRDGIAATQGSGGTRIQATVSIEGSTSWAGHYCSRRWLFNNGTQVYNSPDGQPIYWSIYGTSRTDGSGVVVQHVTIESTNGGGGQHCNPNVDEQGVYGL